MVPHDPQSEALFHELCDQPAAMRDRLLAERCPEDPALRARVAALLAADQDRSGALEGSARDAARDEAAPDPMQALAPGRWIGRYEIVRLLGAGGMGCVYEAIQDHPHRRVALKVLRALEPGPESMHRFRREAELLAQLSHPAVAQVFEAGVHASDQGALAYFAMEFLPDALPLPQYAAARGLSLRQRLELFAQFCDGVQQGHLRGVIHRDLKPGNLLVDADGRPRVIDFGVARVTRPDAPRTTLQTTAGQLVGTLAYMSPEQIGAAPGPVDARSDVYSLGVALYELLAGHRLFDLAGLPLPTAVRLLERDPPPLRTVDRALRGDLDAIVMRAIERDPARRYPDAGALAEDIRRHLEDRPVEARAAGALYRAAKFTRRHRALVIGGAIALAGLLGGAGAAVWKAIDATAQRDRAQREARRAERVMGVLKSLLAEVDPREGSADVRLRDVLSGAGERIERELATEPETLAEVHALLGSMFVRLELLPEGRTHLQRAVDLYQSLYGPRDGRVASTISDLAWAYFPSDAPQAEALFNRAMELRVELFGAESSAVAISRIGLACAKRWNGDVQPALDLCEQAIPILEQTLGAAHPETAYALFVAGRCHCDLGECEAGVARMRRALALQTAAVGEDDLNRAEMLDQLGACLSQGGLTEEAEFLLAESRRIRILRLGDRGKGDDPPLP